MAGIIAQGRRKRSRHEEVEALVRAFAERDLRAIQALADAGCDLDAASGGLTVLMRSVLRRDAVAVEWILAAGADAQVLSSDGKAALDLARELGAAELIELLILAAPGSEGSGEAVAEPAPSPPPPSGASPAAKGRAGRSRTVSRTVSRTPSRTPSTTPSATTSSVDPPRPEAIRWGVVTDPRWTDQGARR